MGFGNTCTSVGVAIGISVGAIGITYGTIRGLIDCFSDAIIYDMKCVKAEEIVDATTIIELTACKDSQVIGIKRIDGFKSYGMMARRDNSGKGFVVEEIVLGDEKYARESGPPALFATADKKWKEYWGKAECDEILNKWNDWKVDETERQREEERLRNEIQQYGDTIENLVDKL